MHQLNGGINRRLSRFAARLSFRPSGFDRNLPNLTALIPMPTPNQTLSPSAFLSSPPFIHSILMTPSTPPALPYPDAVPLLNDDDRHHPLRQRD